MLELLRQEFGGRVVVAVATERSDGDMHPFGAECDLLEARQVAATTRPWVMVDEVHGVAIHRCGDGEVHRGVAGVADLIVSPDGCDPVAVWVADCAPVILFDSLGAVVACHAGWRGLAAGVIDVAVSEVSRPVVAVLGPCIHRCCYEFGDDDLELVAAGVGVAPEQIAAIGRDGRRCLDVPAAVGFALGRHGIELAVTGSCTGCDERWFSHRVRADLGRHAVVAWSEAC